jgi:hypothetical protein
MHDELKKECPNCPKRKTRRGDLRGVALELISDNYSECGKNFQVSYRINQITEIYDEDDER